MGGSSRTSGRKVVPLADVLLPFTLLVSFQAGRITLTEPGVSMKVLCADLGKASNMKLEAGPDVAGMSVVLRVRDLPAQEVMDKIAATAMATWVKLGDNQFRLQRSKEDRQRIWDQHIKYRSGRFATAVKNYDAATKPGDALDLAGYSSLIKREQELINDRGMDAYQRHIQAQELRAKRPFSKLLAELLLRIDPKSVAEIEPNSYRIYTNKPSALEFAFTGEVQPFLENFAKAQDLLLQAQAGSRNWKKLRI